MEHKEEYGDWCAGESRGMVLGNYVEWKGYGGYGECEDEYCWGCWVDGEGRVDAEVRGAMGVKS
jgi:hypothetical protein